MVSTSIDRPVRRPQYLCPQESRLCQTAPSYSWRAVRELVAAVLVYLEETFANEAKDDLR
jgi:hypothetical protein